MTARRAFHTLKGSGRVVGATALAEFAWSIENLMNRLLDKTQTRSPPILAVLRDALVAVPQLIDQLETGKAPAADHRTTSLARAQPAGGRQATAMGHRTPPRAAHHHRAHHAASRMPSLAESRRCPSRNLPSSDIYARETDSHVGTVRAWLAKVQGQPDPHVLPETGVSRQPYACRAVPRRPAARHGVRLAEPLNQWLRKSFDSGVGVSAQDLALIGDCMTAMETISRNLDESTGFFAMHGVAAGAHRAGGKPAGPAHRGAQQRQQCLDARGAEPPPAAAAPEQP